MSVPTLALGVDDADYMTPFAFTGTLSEVKLTVDHPVITEADKMKLEKAMKTKD